MQSDNTLIPSEPSLKSILALVASTLAALAFSLFCPWLPSPLPADAAADRFSAGRAMIDLETISIAAHPIGSSRHNEVRDLIVQKIRSLGYQPKVSTLLSSDADAVSAGAPIYVGEIQNISVVLPGTDSNISVLTVAHYDSVPTGPGASDNGLAVAAAIESIRALQTRPLLRHSVEFLFTDGEELGLLGAKAFVETYHDKPTPVVLNFDAAGTRGPDMLFETGPGNSRLIPYFSKASYPFGNSFSYELYKHINADTDFSPFKHSGWTGLNFAFADNSIYYHTMADSLVHVDQEVLQQRGSNMLDLIQLFGDLDVGAANTSDLVFFSLPGWTIVRYAYTYTPAVAGILTIALAICVLYAFRAKLLTLAGVAFGAGMLLAMFAVSFLIGTGTALLIAKLHPDYELIAEGGYHPKVYIAAIICMVICEVLLFYNWMFKRTHPLNICMGGVCLGVLLLIIVTIISPGATYILAFPLAGQILTLGLWMVLSEKAGVHAFSFRGWLVALIVVDSLPAIFIIVPTIRLIFVGLGLGAAGVGALFVPLLASMLVPQIRSISRYKKAPALLVLASMALLGLGSVRSGFDSQHPRPDSIFYGVDMTAKRAVWASFDSNLDTWVSCFIGAKKQQGALPEYLPWNVREISYSSAPIIRVEPPTIVPIEDTTVNEERRVRLHIRPSAGSMRSYVGISPVTSIISVAVEGLALVDSSHPIKPFENPQAWGFYFYPASPTGFDVLVSTKPQPVTVTLIDELDGLATNKEISSCPLRPDSTSPSADVFTTDRTLLRYSTIL